MPAGETSSDQARREAAEGRMVSAPAVRAVATAAQRSIMELETAAEADERMLELERAAKRPRGGSGASSSGASRFVGNLVPPTYEQARPQAYGLTLQAARCVALMWRAAAGGRRL
jgi:hypothetical protein